MVEKDTYFFAINKYKSSHIYVNPYLNWDHQQLDSNLVADHIKAMIKAQFTLSVAAIQATIMEKSGLSVISYRHPGITVVVTDVHLGWTEPYAYHRCNTPNYIIIVLWHV